MARNIPKIPKMYIDKDLMKQYEEERIEQIYQEVKLRTRVRQINKMIGKLKRAGHYEESLAVENILNYLGSTPVGVGKTKSGYINLRSVTNKGFTQMTGIHQAIDQFLKNRTSTVEGFEELYKERRQELYNVFNDKDFIDSLSDKDLRNIYSVFQSNAFKRNSRKFDSKTFFTLYTKAIDKKYSKEMFMKELSYYIDTGSDDDLKEDISIIYDDFISRFTKR